jgi:hypothetical protein
VLGGILIIFIAIGVSFHRGGLRIRGFKPEPEMHPVIEFELIMRIMQMIHVIQD